MRHLYAIAAFTLCLSSPLVAHLEGGCLIYLATVTADGPDGTAMVLKTYRALWDKAGGVKVSVESIAAIVAGKDPFLIPDQKETDLDNLQRQMKQLEGLVEARGWNTPPIREAVLADLQRHLTGVEVQVEKQQTAVTKSGVLAIAFPLETKSTLSPDKKFLVGIPDEKVKGSKENPYPFVVIDVDTGATEMREGPKEPFTSPISFSADGQWLYAAEPGAQLVKIPYRNGHPDWAKAVTLGEKGKFNLSAGLALPSLDGQRVFISKLHEEAPEHVFNLQTGERTEIKLTKYFDAHSPGGWGTVPGKDELFFTVSNSEKDTTELLRVTVDPDGQVQRVGKPLNLRASRVPNVIWHPDGTRLLAWGESEVSYYGGKKKDKAKGLALPTIGLEESVRSAAVHPEGQDAALLVRPNPRRMRPRPSRNPRPADPSRIEWLDLKTMTVKGSHPLPEGWYSRVEFLPDGRLAIHEAESGKVTILDLKYRFNPE